MIAKTIVVGVELENQPERLLAEVAGIASANDSSVHAISVLEPHIGLLRRQHKEEGRLAEVMAELERLAAECGDFARELTLHVRWGNPTDEIVHLAIEANADLIAVGEFRAGSGGRSSVSRLVLENAACAVLVVAPNREAEEKEGLMPHHKICHQCEDVRAESGGKTWYCTSHHDPIARIAKRVKPKED